MKFGFCSLVLLTLCTFSCSRKVKVYAYRPMAKLEAATRSLSPLYCKDPLNYVPDTLHPDHFMRKKLRINWHLISDENGRHNFSPQDGATYMYNLTRNANERLIKNFRMTLPLGNKTPAYDPHLSWVISGSNLEPSGIYHHKLKNPLYFVNKGDRRTDVDDRIIGEVGVGLDTVINVFVVPFPPDSIGKMKLHNAGIALGNHVKIGGIYQLNQPDWMWGTMLNHEMGHILGLNHAWHYDDCADTPEHSNCWNYTSYPPCDLEVSNNLMDYNSQQMAITPCQIGKMHLSLSDTLSQVRKMMVKDYCINEPDSIFINDEVKWIGERDMNKTIIVQEGGHLTICCRLGMASGTAIWIKTGGMLTLQDVTLHNDCGLKWEGVFIEERGKNKGIVNEIGGVKILDVK
jgi:hypothetical protein